MPTKPTHPADEPYPRKPNGKHVSKDKTPFSAFCAKGSSCQKETSFTESTLDAMWARMTLREERPAAEPEAPPPPPPENASREEKRAYRAAIRKIAVANIRKQVQEIETITRDTEEANRQRRESEAAATDA